MSDTGCITPNGDRLAILNLLVLTYSVRPHTHWGQLRTAEDSYAVNLDSKRWKWQTRGPSGCMHCKVWQKYILSVVCGQVRPALYLVRIYLVNEPSIVRIYLGSGKIIFTQSISSQWHACTYLIFVTCTTCSAGVKISRPVSKNSSNNVIFTTITTLVVIEWWWWHHNNTTDLRVFGVKFLSWKWRWCKKNDKYEVCDSYLQSETINHWPTHSLTDWQG